MTIHLNSPYRNKCSTQEMGKGIDMIELANAIQADLRLQACRARLAANLPRVRTLSLGGFRITVTRDNHEVIE